MTCLVFSLEKSRHVHIVDVVDGGYPMAAWQLYAPFAHNSPQRA